MSEIIKYQKYRFKIKLLILILILLFILVSLVSVGVETTLLLTLKLLLPALLFFIGLYYYTLVQYVNKKSDRLLNQSVEQLYQFTTTLLDTERILRTDLSSIYLYSLVLTGRFEIYANEKLKILRFKTKELIHAELQYAFYCGEVDIFNELMVEYKKIGKSNKGLLPMDILEIQQFVLNKEYDLVLHKMERLGVEEGNIQNLILLFCKAECYRHKGLSQNAQELYQKISMLNEGSYLSFVSRTYLEGKILHNNYIGNALQTKEIQALDKRKRMMWLILTVVITTVLLYSLNQSTNQSDIPNFCEEEGASEDCRITDIFGENKIDSKNNIKLFILHNHGTNLLYVHINKDTLFNSERTVVLVFSDEFEYFTFKSNETVSEEIITIIYVDGKINKALYKDKELKVNEIEYSIDGEDRIISEIELHLDNAETFDLKKIQIER